jgi:arabinose-5-phosphate isomerase
MHSSQQKGDSSRIDILNRAVQTLKMEGDAIHKLASNLGDEFVDVISTILESKGRIVLTGVGKSADVSRKIVATLNSTGSPAFFVHAGDAVHGDLGGIQSGDVVLCLSKSGRSAEIAALAPLIRAAGNPIIALTGVRDSQLAKLSDHVILAGEDPEACPFDLAPTTSTAVQMAIGDAIALCLMEAKGFGAEDFARNHPGGTLGKRLTVLVSDLVDSSRLPLVAPTASLQDILISMTAGRYGATVVIDSGSIAGIITDGDLRRALESGLSSGSVVASDIMGSSPLTIQEHRLAADAAQSLRERGVTQIIAINSSGNYSGIVHLHDLIREGIVN